jgi:hypothetical protein
MLTGHLMRTFKKRVFSTDEVNIAQTVQKILAETVTTESILKSYMASFMTFDETPVIAYVKLFLLYAQTADEFRKIAMFLIASNKNLQIASI